MRSYLALSLVGLVGCAASGGNSAPAAPPASQPASAPADGHGHHGHHGDHDHAKHASKHMEHRFEDPEYWAQRFDHPERDAWQKPAEVIALMALAEGAAVADIGAGTGYFLPHLSKAVGANGKVWGLDIEPNLVAYMTERAAKAGLTNVEAKQVAADDPQLPADALDAVLIVDTWHHIAGRAAYAKKILAGLKPGGALYVVDFTMDSPSGPPAKHRIPPEVVVETLRSAGFEAEVMQEALPRQYVVKGRRP